MKLQIQNQDIVVRICRVGFIGRNEREPPGGKGKAGGAEGIRTPDLLIANETLYQLSYDPIHQDKMTVSLGTENPSCNSVLCFTPQNFTCAKALKDVVAQCHDGSSPNS